MNSLNEVNIFVIEDNDTMRLGITDSLKREGFPVRSFADPLGALKEFRRQPVPLVITDLKMSPADGLEVLRQVKAVSPQTEVLLISAYGSVEVAVQAMQTGAADFLTKPFSPEELRIRIKKICLKIEQSKTLEQLRERNLVLRDELHKKYGEMIGNSPAIRQVFKLVEQVAGEDSTVLIEGESGTGKELVAHAIHHQSRRSEMPFIRVNCGALNENLLESELFGHEKGAFTGAIRQKKGRFELADGGTLFLDEIGDISPQLQVKLLRVIQEKEFERVGGEKTIKSQVRIISATNKNLRKLIAENRFREDLFYRLSVIPIQLPSLRERKEDIPLLADYFLDKMTVQKGLPKKQISQEGMELLVNYSWPGNIRELENVIERLRIISPSETIGSELIARQLGSATGLAQSPVNLPLEEAIYTFEKNLILHALNKSNGVKNRAAKLLGIRTSTLYYKLEKFGL